jgi:hypothetical protein
LESTVRVSAFDDVDQDFVERRLNPHQDLARSVKALANAVQKSADIACFGKVVASAEFYAGS